MTNFGRRRSIAADSLRGIALGVLCFAAASGGCAQKDTTPVARGEYYAAGKPDYDEFFVKLYRHQLDTANALKLEQAARDELARAIGAAPNAKASELEPSLKKVAGELEQAGVEVTLPAAVSEGGPELEVKGEPKSEQAAQIDAIRAATRKLRSVELLARDGGSELDALRTRSIELDREVDRVFWTDGAGKRSEVKNNLSDARELIALMNDSRKGVGQSSTQLLAILQVTFKPKAPAPVVEAENDSPPKKKKGRASAKRVNAGKKGNAAARPASSRAPRPEAAAKPAPAPKPSPAPKAEFEP
jgi:hypothetical protein